MNGAAKERRHPEVMGFPFISVAPVLVGRRGEGHIAPWRAGAIRRSVAAAARSAACERESGPDSLAGQ